MRADVVGGYPTSTKSMPGQQQRSLTKHALEKRKAEKGIIICSQ